MISRTAIAALLTAAAAVPASAAMMTVSSGAFAFPTPVDGQAIYLQGFDPALGTPGESAREMMLAALASRDGTQLAEELMAIGVPCAPIFTVDAALQHPHTAHREMVVRIGDHYQGVASPVKLSRTPASYRLAPPTALHQPD